MSNALIEAIESGDVDRVAKLLAAGADPNTTRPGYYTPLQDAVWEYEPPDKLGGLDAMVLLAHGADPNVLDNDRYTVFELIQMKERYANPPLDPADQERLREIRQLLGDPSV